MFIINDAYILLRERRANQLFQALGRTHTVAVHPLVPEDQDAVKFLDFGKNRLLDGRVHALSSII